MECKIGQVRNIQDGYVIISIERHSACSGCHAKGFCTSMDQKDQEIKITDYPIGLQVGDLVRVVPATNAKPIKAVLFAFIIPLILMALSAIVMSSMGLGEGIMVLTLLVILLVYALILRGNRGYFEREFRLKVEPIV